MKNRTFLHIDEFGDTGFKALSWHICLSDPLVIWAPTSTRLKSTNSSITPDLLIKLLELDPCPIRIACREQWLNRKWRNNHKYPGAKWVNGFDDIIRDISKNDDCIADSKNRRVVINPPETGWECADNFLEEHGRSIRAKIGKLREKLPIGMKEKADPYYRKGKPYVRLILRDIFNLVNATKDVDADMPIVPSEHINLVKGLIDVKSTSPYLGCFTANSAIYNNSSNATNEHYLEALEILKDLQKVVGNKHKPKDFLGYLKKGQHKHLQELCFGENASLSMPQSLLNRIASDIDLPRSSTQIKEFYTGIGTLGGLLPLWQFVQTIAQGIGESNWWGMTGFAVPIVVILIQQEMARHRIISTNQNLHNENQALYRAVLGINRTPTLAEMNDLQHAIKSLTTNET